jgi:hypothetical protein
MKASAEGWPWFNILTCQQFNNSTAPRLVTGAFGFVSRAKDHAAAGGVVPVAEVGEAGLSGKVVNLAQLPQKAGGRGPNIEGFEVGKIALPFLDPEKVGREAVR